LSHNSFIEYYINEVLKSGPKGIKRDLSVVFSTKKTLDKGVIKAISYCFIISFFALKVDAQNLYKYQDRSGNITYTSKKPTDKKYSIVTLKKPSNSVFIQRGIGYSWSSTPKPSSYDDLIISFSKEYRLDPALIKAVIHIESAFNERAVSSAGARGLMQLMPATASRFGVKNSYDPSENMYGGVQYLRWLYERFNGNLRFVLAAYNAGEGAVDKYKGIPPYKETQDYVKKVIKMATLYQKDFSGAQKKDTTDTSKPTIRARMKNGSQ
jgi:soluble lytic murein transglycosylase-like protein